MHALLLWNDAYFFGGIAQFFLIAGLIIVGLAVLNSWLSSAENEFIEPKVAPGQPLKASKESGCTVFLLIAAGLVFLLFVLAKFLAS